jgi:hypothetical protein
MDDLLFGSCDIVVDTEPFCKPFTNITLPLGENIHVINVIINLNKITNPITTINKNANLATQLFDSRKSFEPLTTSFDEKSLNDAVSPMPALVPLFVVESLEGSEFEFEFEFDVSAIVI